MKTIKILTIIIFIAATRITAGPIQESYSLEAEYDYAGALTLTEKVAIAEPRNYLAQLRTGWLAYMSGDFKKSIQYYNKAIALAPESIEARLGYMLPIMGQGNYNQVVVVGLALLKMDPKNVIARKRIAYSLYLSGRYVEAQKYYQYLLREYPSDGDVLSGLGWTLLKQNKKTEAYSAFSKAIIVKPNDKMVITGLQYSK